MNERCREHMMFECQDCEIADLRAQLTEREGEITRLQGVIDDKYPAPPNHYVRRLQVDLREAEAARDGAEEAFRLADEVACREKARADTAEAALQEWRTDRMADATGHLFRCAKVNGVWACAKGCAVLRAESGEGEIERLTRTLVVVRGDAAEDQARLATALHDAGDAIAERNEARRRADTAEAALREARVTLDLADARARDCDAALARLARMREALVEQGDDPAGPAHVLEAMGSHEHCERCGETRTYEWFRQHPCAVETPPSSAPSGGALVTYPCPGCRGSGLVYDCGNTPPPGGGEVPPDQDAWGRYQVTWRGVS